MKRTVNLRCPWLVKVLICLAFALAGCLPAETPPDMNAVLPAGYTEKRVPKDLEEVMGITSQTGLIWARCIDCKEDWDGLKIHLMNQVGNEGWTDTTAKWLPVINPGDIPDDVAADLFHIISSSSGNLHIMSINLQLIREIGGTIDTTGDFYVAAIWDNLRHYK